MNSALRKHLRSSTLALRALHSPLVQRSQFASRAGLSYLSDAGTFDRDMFEALGYNRKLTARDYLNRYERGGIAERIIEAYPRATWTSGISIQETEDLEEVTKFEEEVDALFKRLALWPRLMRADILSGIGQYGIILIGASGELKSELPSLKGEDSIKYITTLSEDRAEIDRLVQDTDDERFGLPEYYKLTLGDQNSSKEVHYSRIIHVAEGLLEDDIYGKPRLRAVWNYLDDLVKLVGGGSEAAWKRMDPGLHLDLDPELELDEDEENALADEVDEYIHGMRRVVRTRGVDLNMLSASVAGFGPNVTSVLTLISGTTGIPIRILTGSERGELASSQDRGNWSDRISERRLIFAEPLVRNVVDLFISAGAITEPKEGYSVVWPDVDELDEREKASVLSNFAQANRAQKEAEGKIIITADEIRDIIFGLEPNEDTVVGNDATAPVAEIEDETEETEEAPIVELSMRSAQFGDDDPAWKALHKVADSYQARVDGAFQRAFEKARDNVDLASLEAAIASQNRAEIERLLAEAVSGFGEDLDNALPQEIATIFTQN